MGIFQSLTLGGYLRSATAGDMRHVASQELGVLGPCYVRSSVQLQHSAGTLARLLGGYDTAVTIVTPSGAVLAQRGTGPPGARQPMHLSATTIRRLIPQAGTPAPRIPVSTCPRPADFGPGFRRHRMRDFGVLPTLVSGGGTLLIAVPLGPPGQTLGYAVLGRSLAPENATVNRVLLVFGIGALVALVLAALIALPIINRALRPLTRVADTAEAIAGGNVEERANLAHSPDEIGRLGEDSDTMVDRLQEAISAAEASEERMRRFLADASHELRTPVTVLRGASQVLLRQGSSERPDLVSALRDMYGEATRLARLVDDLLTLSRLDTGQQLAPQRVSLREFLREFLDRYGRIWQERAIWIDEASIDGTVANVDPEALRRILTNLIDNAARYTRPDGSITIGVRPHGRAIELTVADEGPGLRPEDARRVFDRFYRANPSRSRESGGTGLGLPIVRGLVESSGGSISFDTGPERGTTVTIILPAAPQEAATGEQPTVQRAS